MIVQLAKWFQKNDPGLLNPLEKFVAKSARYSNTHPIFIISLPRSGSTLLYQCLTGLFCVKYISNFHYVFYRYPYLFRMIGESFLKDYSTDFKSHRGFIQGLNGPAEANQFWNHWFGAFIEETSPNANNRRLDYIIKYLAWLEDRCQVPFVSCWVGHSFYMAHLVKQFPNAFFILLIRDKLSIAYSLLKCRRQVYGNDSTWFSIRPTQCQSRLFETAHKQVAAQVFFAMRHIQKGIHQYERQSFVVSYKELCHDPMMTLKNLQNRAAHQGIKLESRSEVEWPMAFTYSNVEPDMDKDTRAISNAFDKLENEFDRE